MRKFITFCFCIFALGLSAQTMNLTETQSQLGLSLEAPALQDYQSGQFYPPDSVIVFYTCNPYQGQRGLSQLTLLPGDTAWFDKKQFWFAFGIVMYPFEGVYYRGKWCNPNFVTTKKFCSTNNITWYGSETPSMNLVYQNPSPTNFTLEVQSNAMVTRLLVYDPNYNLVLYQNLTGVQGQENNFLLDKSLPPGTYRIFVRGIYENHCQGSYVFNEIVVIQ